MYRSVSPGISPRYRLLSIPPIPEESIEPRRSPDPAVVGTRARTCADRRGLACGATGRSGAPDVRPGPRRPARLTDRQLVGLALRTSHVYLVTRVGTIDSTSRPA